MVSVIDLDMTEETTLARRSPRSDDAPQFGREGRLPLKLAAKMVHPVPEEGLKLLMDTVAKTTPVQSNWRKHGVPSYVVAHYVKLRFTQGDLARKRGGKPLPSEVEAALTPIELLYYQQGPDSNTWKLLEAFLANMVWPSVERARTPE